MAKAPGARIDSAQLAAACIEIAEDRKAGNVVRLDVGELSLLAEHLVLCTASSEPHLRALENHLGRELLRRFQVKPRAVDGSPASGWIVMDFPGVVVHLLTETARETYQLEHLWRNAPTLAEIEELADRLVPSAGGRGRRR